VSVGGITESGHIGSAWSSQMGGVHMVMGWGSRDGLTIRVVGDGTKMFFW